MTTDVTFGTDTLNAIMDAITAQCDGGAGAAVLTIMEADDTVLGELVMTDPSFGASVAGVITAAAITKDDSANASGTAAKFKIEDSDSNICVEGSCGEAGSGAALILNTTTIVATIDIEVSSLTLTLANT